MKKFIFSIIITMITVLSLSSCHHKSGPQTIQVDKEDVEYVKACLDKMDSHEFKSKEDAMSYFIRKQQDSHVDSIIQHVPIQILERMCNVVYDKNGIITPQLVAKEYDESYDKVYKHLSIEPYSRITVSSNDTINVE